MKIALTFLFLFLALPKNMSHAAGFPLKPDLTLTTGKLCDRPIKARYPEGIPYCERDVTFQTKELVILQYDQTRGYSISRLPREDFKIDHLIPLCAGGSNDVVNLWPQHKSVYLKTDPIEPVLCEKMALGKLKQVDAVKIIIEAKTRHERIPVLLNYLQRL